MTHNPDSFDQKEELKTLVVRASPFQLLLAWGGALLLLAISLLIYIFSFWLPYRGVPFSGCPTICHRTSDCNVPRCGTRRHPTECSNSRCILPSGHSHFLGASVVIILFFLGLGWAVIALTQSSMRLVLDDKGIVFSHLRRKLNIPWEEFLGISYRGVHTRLGFSATLYSITGDNGIFSFLVSGLPPDTSTRDLEPGTFLLFKISRKDSEKIIEMIQKKTARQPEPERDW